MTNDPWEKVTIVIVVHNSASIIQDCLKSLPSLAHVILVDNASSDNTVELAIEAFPSIKAILNSINMGFGTANNIGFEASETPYTFLLNPDTTIPEGQVEELVATLEKYDDAAVVAPLLYSPAGHLELSLMLFGEYRAQSYDKPPEGNICTGFITGAAMLWRMSAWNEIGGFDEAIFIYGEDTDISIRTMHAGYSMIITPNAFITHLGGGSEKPSKHTSWRKDWHLTWGGLYVQKKWASPGDARSRAWRLFFRNGLKALFYIIIVNPRRFMGNYARLHAALSFLANKPSWSGRDKNKY